MWTLKTPRIHVNLKENWDYISKCWTWLRCTDTNGIYLKHTIISTKRERERRESCWFVPLLYCQTCGAGTRMGKVEGNHVHRGWLGRLLRIGEKTPEQKETGTEIIQGWRRVLNSANNWIVCQNIIKSYVKQICIMKAFRILRTSIRVKWAWNFRPNPVLKFQNVHAYNNKNNKKWSIKYKLFGSTMDVDDITIHVNEQRTAGY